VNEIGLNLDIFIFSLPYIIYFAPHEGILTGS